jgi:hypothetical protein
MKKSSLSYSSSVCKPTKDTVISDDKQINMLDSWHKAAADAKYDTYFVR